MQADQKLGAFVVFASLLLLGILPLAHSSSNEVKSSNSIHRNNKHSTKKLSPELTFEVTIHGFLLWSSMGFLMPIGILVIRMSNGVQYGRKLKALFYFHVILQILAVLLATAGAVMSIRNFENTFNNNHQKIGLGLYGIIWFQVLIGFFRPIRGCKQRSIWFFVHWLSGNVITILGIMNIYTGLHAYHKRTSKSVKLWSTLFTVEVCLIAFLYLLQDKWGYMKKQGVILDDGATKATDQVNFQDDRHKDLEQRRSKQALEVEKERFTFQ